jgi:lysophospholipase L1-like esterase
MPIDSPADISDLGFYVRSDTGLYQDTGGTTPATADGDPVALWEDQGGGGYDLTQSTSGKRPTLDLDSGYKSTPAVAFDRASTQWMSNAAFHLSSNPTAGTWVLAYRTVDPSASQAILSPHNNSLATGYDSGNVFFTRHGGAAQGGSFSSPHEHARVVICRYDSGQTGDANRFRIRSNRVERSLSYSNPPILGIDAGSAVSAGLWVGRDWSGEAAIFNGRLWEAAYYTRALTDPECEDVEDYFAETYFDLGEKKVFCAGDSLTTGYPDNNTNGLDWPTKLGLLLPSWTVAKHANVALPIDEIEIIAASQIDPDRDEWRARDVVIHQGGTNNLYNMDDADTLAEMAASVSARHAKGFEVLVVTVPPMGPQDDKTGPEEAEFEARRLLYNAALRDGDSGADGVIDWAAAAAFSDPTDLTYFNADLVHFTAAGNDVAAELAQAAIEPVSPPVTSPYVHDTFAGTPAAGLTTRAGEVGAAWTNHPAGAGAWVLSDADRAFSTVGSYGVAQLLASGVAASGVHDVLATWRFRSFLVDGYCGLVLRYNGTADSGYRLRYESYTANRRWRLERVDAGTPAVLDTYVNTPALDVDIEVRVEMKVDGISVFIGGVERLTSSDTTYAGAGRTGINAFGDPAATNSTGQHLDRIAVVDAGDGWPGEVGGGGGSIVPIASNYFRRMRAG